MTISAMQSAPSFSKLMEHTSVSKIHLKDLLNDSKRTDALTFEHNGVFVDFSRQNCTEETLRVRRHLESAAIVVQ